MDEKGRCDPAQCVSDDDVGNRDFVRFLDGRQPFRGRFVIAQLPVADGELGHADQGTGFLLGQSGIDTGGGQFVSLLGFFILGLLSPVIGALILHIMWTYCKPIRGL